jgi:hypothetical protein
MLESVRHDSSTAPSASTYTWKQTGMHKCTRHSDQNCLRLGSLHSRASRVCRPAFKAYTTVSNLEFAYVAPSQAQNHTTKQVDEIQQKFLGSCLRCQAVLGQASRIKLHQQQTSITCSVQLIILMTGPDSCLQNVKKSLCHVSSMRNKVCITSQWATRLCLEPLPSGIKRTGRYPCTNTLPILLLHPLSCQILNPQGRKRIENGCMQE